MSESGSTTPSDFERAKWDSELELRRREVVVQEAQQRSRDDDLALRREELALKRQESVAARWTSPLVVAVLAASIAGIGNAVVTVLNGRLQRDLEYSKAESSLILEVVKTGDPEKAAANLQFLLDTTLIADPDRVRGIRTYLKSRRPGDPGVALPASDKNFTFEGTAGATPEATRAVSNALTPYIKHLIDIGFPSELPRVGIRIDPKGTNPSYYIPNEKLVVLSPQGAKDDLFPLAEYTIHALEIVRPSPGLDVTRRFQLEYGVRDYLVASYLNDPNLGLRVKAIYGVVSASLQLLTPRTYADVTATTEAHEAGAVWANAFWSMRQALGPAGPATVDALVVGAWRTLPAGIPDDRYPAAFIAALRKAAQDRLTGPDRATVDQILRDHGFPVR